MTTTLPRAEALKELEQVRDDLNEFVERGAFVEVQLGVTYYSALSRRLAESAGFKNAWEYFSSQVKGLTRETLSTYSNESSFWGATRTLKHGVERLKALRKYLRVNPYIGQWPDPDPGWLPIRVPRPDGSWQVKTFADCSLEEMRRAATPPRPKSSWDDVPMKDRLRAVLLKTLIPQYFGKIAPVRFSTRVRDGRGVVTFYDVPTAQLEELIAALQECIAIKPLSLHIRKQAAP